MPAGGQNMPRKIRIREHATAEDEPKVKADLRLLTEFKKASDKNGVMQSIGDAVVRDIEDAIISGDPPPAACENCRYWQASGHVNGEQVPMGVCLNDESHFNELERFTASSHCDHHEYRPPPGINGGNDFPVTADEGQLFVLRGRHYVRANGAWLPLGNTP